MKRSARYLCLLLLFALPVVAQEAVAAKPAPLPEASMSQSGEEIWADLMLGNKRFMAGESQHTDLVPLRQKLVQGQHPKVIVLACSDSRVAPEILFDKSLGDLFVVRAAGNIADAIGVGSIEYAVEHLGSSVLVVLGHEKCGAVTAACSEEKMPTPNLQAIVDKINPAVLRAKPHSKPEDLVDTAIRENVHQSAQDIMRTSAVLREALQSGKLTVVEAVYKLASGEVVRLDKLSLIVPAFKLDVGDVMRAP